AWLGHSSMLRMERPSQLTPCIPRFSSLRSDEVAIGLLLQTIQLSRMRKFSRQQDRTSFSQVIRVAQNRNLLFLVGILNATIPLTGRLIEGHIANMPVVCS